MTEEPLLSVAVSRLNGDEKTIHRLYLSEFMSVLTSQQQTDRVNLEKSIIPCINISMKKKWQIINIHRAHRQLFRKLLDWLHGSSIHNK